MAMLTKINVYSGVLLMALSTVYVGFYMIPEYIAKKRRAEEERLELLEEQFAKKHGVRRLPFKWETELMTKSYDDWTFEERKRMAEEERLELFEEDMAKKYHVRRMPFQWETELITKSYDDWTFEEKKRFAMARRPGIREVIRKIETEDQLEDFFDELATEIFKPKENV
ncbi:hypothetical protein Bhyg_05050 [Pseudolycoriella hygida]|uniref:Uncharacterized protein n=1 Tax=Pseudolycoriella hygida TaxID=35572 RepID=A0A9Q0SAI3_9DIPT|nr:hypothetical protein Bhyg_05050 [Pseudolycoriella hygida]